MATVVRGDFEWDDEKAVANLEKHDVSFEEAATVFEGDTLALPDPTSPENVVSIGFSAAARTLLVVSTERGLRTRIISARKANRHERTMFNDQDR